MIQKKTFKLSPSSISLMEECQRCFWLTKHNLWKRPESIFPSLPSGMDKILKAHFDKFTTKLILPPELRKYSECNGCRLFSNLKLLNRWRDEKNGISWQDKDGNILHGAIDNLLVKNERLIVLDYKTRGFPLKDSTHEHYQNQIDIYNFLLRKNGYMTEDYSFLLFYYPKEVLENGEVLFDTSLIKIKVNIENAARLFYKAINLLNGPCPDIQEKCEWCKLIKVNDI